MYAITGATGNTGSVIATKLLARGEKVRAIGRDASRLGGLVKKGAEVFVADVTDAAALTKALSGAKAVYAMIPPNPGAPDISAYQERVSDATVAAITKAGVGHVALLSSVGADKPQKTGPVVGLHNFEQKLNNIAGLNALYVRAGYFMQNTLAQIGVIQNFGLLGGPLRDDLPVAMIAARDIGEWAAEELLRLNFSGKQARELLGQRDLTYKEVASLIGQAIGRPTLSYSQFPSALIKPALLQSGMSSNMADLILEMSEALNSGYMVPLEARSAQNTPTTFETFVAEEFAPRFKGIGKAAAS
jgi:uncharacterized protein YbjT (DUF2867 family)